MPVSKLGFLVSSPIVRHPFLLARKLRARMGIYPAIAPPSVDPPPYTPHRPIAALFRRWIDATAPARRDLCSEEVFGRLFDRRDLLRWCKHGPERGVGLQADIKTPWEFARSQHMPLLSAFVSPDAVESLAKKLAAESHELLEAGQDLSGPLWTNAMEVAIRAINWTLADDLLDGRLAVAFGRGKWANAIHLHGRVIWARLEAYRLSSNHYLADLLGLSWIARHFQGDPDAERWRNFADSEFWAALRAQTYPDGGAYEASVPYHALITEMALLHAALLRQVQAPQVELLRRMSAILAAAKRANGSLFAIGDDDSGRILAVDRVSSARSYPDALLTLANLLIRVSESHGPSLFLPHSGWYFHRLGDWHLAANFGGVGFAGRGAHAHCDVFSFCLDWKGQPVFIDPGSYIYTGDPVARRQFRSACAHNVFAPDGRDPYPQPAGDNQLFSLPGPARAYSAQVGERFIFMSGSPFGFPYSRRIEWTLSEWLVRDDFHSFREQKPVWYFQVGPDFSIAEQGDSYVDFVGSVGRLSLRAEFPCRIRVQEGRFAPQYGLSIPCARICAEGNPAKRVSATWRISPR